MKPLKSFVFYSILQFVLFIPSITSFDFYFLLYLVVYSLLLLILLIFVFLLYLFMYSFLFIVSIGFIVCCRSVCRSGVFVPSVVLLYSFLLLFCCVHSFF
jgi:hypothetical protein